MRNNVVFNKKSKTKIRFNDTIVKSSTTERMLQDVTPFEWSQDVLSGDSKVDIKIKEKSYGGDEDEEDCISETIQTYE